MDELRRVAALGEVLLVRLLHFLDQPRLLRCQLAHCASLRRGAHHERPIAVIAVTSNITARVAATLAAATAAAVVAAATATAVVAAVAAAECRRAHLPILAHHQWRVIE